MIEGITTKHQEVYGGKVAVNLFEEGPVKFRWIDVKDNVRESEIVFEKVEKGLNSLLPDIVYFLNRESDDIISIRLIDVEFRSDPPYVDFANRQSWRGIQYSTRGEDYMNPEFQGRDQLLRRHGR